MIITNARSGWGTEGMHVATLPANTVVDDEAMSTFYGLTKGKAYERLRKPSKHERFVLLKPIGHFIIVPITADTRCVEPERGAR